MDIFDLEIPQPEQEPKKPKNTILKKILLIGVIIIFVILVALYIANQQVREFIDIYIFRKQIEENNVVSIELDTEKSQSIYAYSKYITILQNKKLTSYSSSGKQESQIEINISNPIYASNNRFLCVAENNGKTVALISEENKIWEKEIEGSITKVSVNKNGYVCVIGTRASYKTVIILLDTNGKELFTTYLSDTSAIQATISNDNKYLAIGEIDTTGTLIQSNVKIISVEKARKEEKDSIIYIYRAEPDSLLINLTYQDKNKIICLYDKEIHRILDNNQDEKIVDLSKEKVIATDINLANCYVQAIEKTTGIFSSDTQIRIDNIQNNNQNIYTIHGGIKKIHAHKNIIAINAGIEVHFIDTGGWLVKRYVSSQEIQDIVIGDNIVGIVYRGKVEIISI